MALDKDIVRTFRENINNNPNDFDLVYDALHKTMVDSEKSLANILTSNNNKKSFKPMINQLFSGKEQKSIIKNFNTGADFIGYMVKRKTGIILGSEDNINLFSKNTFMLDTTPVNAEPSNTQQSNNTIAKQENIDTPESKNVTGTSVTSLSEEKIQQSLNGGPPEKPPEPDPNKVNPNDQPVESNPEAQKFIEQKQKQEVAENEIETEKEKAVEAKERPLKIASGNKQLLNDLRESGVDVSGVSSFSDSLAERYNKNVETFNKTITVEDYAKSNHYDKGSINGNVRKKVAYENFRNKDAAHIDMLDAQEDAVKELYPNGGDAYSKSIQKLNKDAYSSEVANYALRSRDDYSASYIRQYANQEFSNRTGAASVDYSERVKVFGQQVDALKNSGQIEGVTARTNRASAASKVSDATVDYMNKVEELENINKTLAGDGLDEKAIKSYREKANSLNKEIQGVAEPIKNIANDLSNLRDSEGNALDLSKRKQALQEIGIGYKGYGVNSKFNKFSEDELIDRRYAKSTINAGGGGRSGGKGVMSGVENGLKHIKGGGLVKTAVGALALVGVSNMLFSGGQQTNAQLYNPNQYSSNY